MQASYILERIHQVVPNLVLKFNLKNNYLDEDDPWSGILAATSFVVCSTYHTTLQATSGQLLFSHYILLNATFVSD